MADNNSFASNSFFDHGRKWGGSPTYCELQDSPVVVDPVANSGLMRRKSRNLGGPLKRRKRSLYYEQRVIFFVNLEIDMSLSHEHLVTYLLLLSIYHPKISIDTL